MGVYYANDYPNLELATFYRLELYHSFFHAEFKAPWRWCSTSLWAVNTELRLTIPCPRGQKATGTCQQLVSTRAQKWKSFTWPHNCCRSDRSI